MLFSYSPLLLPLIVLLLVGPQNGVSAEESQQQQQQDDNGQQHQEEPQYIQQLRGLEHRRLQLKLEKEPRIIGGSVVNDPTDRYPYFALMNGEALCGAVLVSSRFVITAAHCSYADTDFQIIGEYGRFSDGIKYKAGRIHPNYNDNDVSNDIAVFELVDDVATTPIKMRQAPLTTSGTTVTVIGFGDTDPSDSISSTSSSLRKVDLQYVPADTCNQAFGGGITSWFGGGNEIDSGMMCAYGSNRDSCGGDSGGPLLIEGGDDDDDSGGGGPSSGDELVGIVSWGISCADEDYPGVYTRVSYFYDWIIQTMCDLNPDPSGLPEGVTCSGSNTGNGNVSSSSSSSSSSSGGSSSSSSSGGGPPSYYLDDGYYYGGSANDDNDDDDDDDNWWSTIYDDDDDDEDDDDWTTSNTGSDFGGVDETSFFEDPLGWLGGLFFP